MLSFLAGILTAVVVQFFVGFIVEPLKTLKDRIGDVEATLVFHANIYLNAGAVNPDACADTARELRRAASDLLRALMLIYAPWTLALVGLPPRTISMRPPSCSSAFPTR